MGEAVATAGDGADSACAGTVPSESANEITSRPEISIGRVRPDGRQPGKDEDLDLVENIDVAPETCL